MRVKLVGRLLAADGTLLAWAPIIAEARGDGALWATQPFVGWGEATGEAVTVSVHWPDVHVEVRTPLPEPLRIQAGVPVTFAWGPAPMVRVGEPPASLPPVTERGPVAIGVPVGSLSAGNLR
jgi:hypothetical protein